MTLNKRQTCKNAVFLALGGLFSGIVNGVFGTGGGIITIFTLSLILKNKTDKKDIFAMTLFACFFMSLFSAFLYANEGRASISEIPPYVIPALFGGTVGAFLLDKINSALLSKIFALLVIYAGITLFMR